jgi:hypothetical protein
VTRKSVRDYADAMRRRYLGAKKRERGRLLDEFCLTTGYHRKSAIRVLGQWTTARPDRRGRERQYGPAVAAALKGLWEASDHLCSKRLAPFLPTLVGALERHGALVLDDTVRAQVLQVAPATIDRLLRPMRPTGRRRPYSQGTASSQLKAQIPLRTFGEWTDVTPGDVQIDLVLHCGESTDVFSLTTLDLVDVATGWTDCAVVWGKGQERVGTAVHHARERLPFALQALHCDNGSEFLNTLLYPWSQQEGIRFTRGRPYKKNDQAYVEQRNWSVVRRLVGYGRYSTRAAEAAFEQLYRVVRPYVNFFQPIRKLVSKERSGAKVVKRYDMAQTPYQRLLASGVLTDVQQASLDRAFQRLNPLQLRAEISRRLDALWELEDRPTRASVTAEPRSALPDNREYAQLSTYPPPGQREKKERSKERKEKGATTTTAING